MPALGIRGLRSPLDRVKLAPVAREQLAALKATPEAVEATSRVAATASSPVVQQIGTLAMHPDVVQAINLSAHPAVVAGIADHPATLALADAMKSPTVQQYVDLTQHPEAVAHAQAMSAPVLAALADAHDAAGVTLPALLKPLSPRATPIVQPAGSTRSPSKDTPKMEATEKVLPMPASYAGVAAGATVDVRVTPQVAGYRIKRIIIDPTIAPGFRVLDIKIGNRSQLAGSGELPASMFDPKVLNEYNFDVCESGTYITLTVRNAGTATADFVCGFAGEEHAK